MNAAHSIACDSTAPHMHATMLGQPGVSYMALQPLTRPLGWLTIIAEHHVSRPGIGVDVMGCVRDPWVATLGDLQGPPQVLAHLGAPLFWFEWDLVAGRSAHRPLWSVCCEPGLLTTGRLPRRPPESVVALRRAVLHSLGGHALASSTEPLVEALEDGGGRLLHVASLAPRGRRDLRLSLSAPAMSAARWLDAVGLAQQVVDLPDVLFGLAGPAQTVGIQVEVSSEGLGSYLALESPLVWQHQRAPSMMIEPWLPGPGTRGHRRWHELLAWVEAPLEAGFRRQLYVKLTSGRRWMAKIYAGVTTVFER